MSSLTVVMPCYNEASRGSGNMSFRNRLELVRRQLESIDYEVMLVDDGSTDDSRQVYESFAEEYDLAETWHCMSMDVNGGKGRAVLAGLRSCTTDYALVLDADMSVEPYVVVKLINAIRGNECYIGTRYAINSRIINPRPPIRKFVSFCCKTLVNLLFGLGVSDSQCGFKLLPTVYCKKLTDFSAGSWLYDVEILYCMKSQGVAIREVAVRWDNMERETTVNALRSIIPSTKALFLLFSKKRFIRSACTGK